MMIRSLISAAILAAATATFAAPASANTYEFDPGHTEVRVNWNHAGFSIQSAEFHDVTGTVTLDEGAIGDAGANVVIAAESIDTGVSALDDHLKSADFLEVENFPDISFVATGVEQTGDKTASVTGDLTIRDVTKPAVFEVEIINIGAHPVGQFFDAYKGEWLGFTARTTIKRSDWGVDKYIPVGSDEIEIVVSTRNEGEADGQLN